MSIKFKSIQKQLICAITNDQYPSVYVWGYWSWRWNKEGKVAYDHWQTLLNYLKNNKQ